MLTCSYRNTVLYFYKSTILLKYNPIKIYDSNRIEKAFISGNSRQNEI